MNLFNLLLTGGDQQGQGGTANAGWESLILPIGLLVVMGLILLFTARSNKKKQQEATKMLNSIAIGDEVITVGGIVGKVVRIKDDNITIESGRDRTKICVVRAYISSVNKGKQDE